MSLFTSFNSSSSLSSSRSSAVKDLFAISIASLKDNSTKDEVFAGEGFDTVNFSSSTYTLSFADNKPH